MVSNEPEIFELGEIVRTIAPPRKIKNSEYLADGTYPIVDQSAAAVAGWTEDKSALVHPKQDGLIVFGDHTCVLKFLTEPFAQGADGIKIIEVRSGFNTHYVFAHLAAFPLRQDGYKRHFSELKRLRVRIPNIRIQGAISGILRTLDSKIAANSAVVETLEQIAQTIFKSWFIDFRPVHAKARGQRPEGMDAETAALFPDSFEESESGLIPAGWSYTEISKFAKVVTGKTPSTSRLELWGRSKMFVTIPDLHHTTVVTTTKRALSSEGSRSLRKHQIPARSTLVSCIATAGLVGWASDELHTNQQINSATPLRDSHSEWLLFKLKSMAPEIAELASSGSIYPNLNKSTFSEMRILLAHDALLDAFSNSVSPFVGLMTALSKQNELLEKLRDAMLPRLISGELEIPEELLVD